MADVIIVARYLLRYELRKLKQADKRTGLIQIYSPGKTPMEVEADDTLELCFSDIERDELDKRIFDKSQVEAIKLFIARLQEDKVDTLLISDEGDRRAASLAVAIEHEYPDFYSGIDSTKLNTHILNTFINKEV